MNDFSSRLRKLRLQKGLKQQDVAEALKFSRSMMSMYENHHEPPYETMIAMAQYFGVTTDYILGVSPEPKPSKDEIAKAIKRLADLIPKGSDSYITSNQFLDLLNALTTYCKAGAPAGDAPLLAVSDYLTHMAAFVRALAGTSTAEMLTASNAVTIDIGRPTAMVAAVLAKEK